MKKFFAVILVIVMLASSAAFASDKDLPRWAAPCEYEFVEDENNMTYYLVDKVILDLQEKLGYYPKYSVKEEQGDWINWAESPVLVINLFRTRILVPVYKVGELIFVPEFNLSEEILAKNDLTELLPKRDDDDDFFNIYAFNLIGGYNIEDVKDDGATLQIIFRHSDELKMLTSVHYKVENAYYLSGEDFRQIFYHLYNSTF